MTPAEAIEMRRRVLAQRNAVGSETRCGRILSNLAENLETLATQDAHRPWATHPMQTLVGLMNWQIDRLNEQI